ncbi:tetratricopeptide repeat protein [Nocardia salmonicida]|uniref:tetratricopeptide repeat protein n=1 Tax=Nocardia salmonicida TaxID=53431 RepID=UPI0033C2CCF2
MSRFFGRRSTPAPTQSVVDSHVGGHILSVSDVAGDVRMSLGERHYRYWCHPFPLPKALTRAEAVALPSAALHPRFAVAPLVDRDTELEKIRRWLNTEDRLAVTLIHAEGGHGKTRLAEHVRRELTTDKWVTWRAVHTVEDVDESATIALGEEQGLLLIVDDAHRWPTSTVETLLINQQAMIRRRPEIKVRVLLLARTTEAWWPVLATTLRDWGVPETVIRLPPPIGETARAAIFDSAFTAYRELLLPPPPPQVRRREPAHYRRDLDLTGPRHATVLGIHMSALSTVHAHATTGIDTVSSYLLDSERTEWVKRNTAGLVATPPQLMQRLVYLSTLTRGLPRAQARALLTLAGMVSDDTDADMLIEDHGRYYPPTETVLNPLQPDLLGEDLLALLTPGRPATAATSPPDDWVIEATHAVLRRPTPATPPHPWVAPILTTLVETAPRWPHLATTLLYPILHQDPLLALCTDTTTLLRLIALPEIPTPILHTLHQHLIQDTERDNYAVLAALDAALLPHRIKTTTDPAHRAALHLDHARHLERVGLRQQAWEATKCAVDLYRDLARTDPTTHQTQLAHALDTLALRLGQALHLREALAPVREAVGLYRDLARTDPTTHQAQLAHSLSIFANLLGEAGHPQEAVAPARESVDLYRDLARTDPTTHQAPLAHALNMFANRLGLAGHHREAVAPARESVDLYRDLARTDPTTHQSPLARALSTLAVRLGEAGHRQEAVVPARESVDLHRELARTDPTAYQASLAHALGALANLLGLAGHHREAVASARESVDLHRELARTDPTTHQAPLARALSTLANRLGEAGHRQEAVAPARESLDLYRELARTDPTTHQSPLAHSLNMFANRLGQAGHEREAVASARESVDLYRDLARTDPTTHQSPLAHSLSIFANLLGEAGHPQEAVAPARESVDLYRDLARTDPTTHQAQLAHALITLANLLEEAGHRQEAVAPAREAVDLYRELVEGDSAAFRFYLAQSLWLLSAVAVETGNYSDLRSGLAAAVEAVTLLEQLVEELPGAYDRILEQARRSKGRAYEQLTVRGVESDSTGEPQDE